MGKRRSGIFWHKSGRWAACPTIEGKRRWFYGATEEEVEQQVNEAKYLAARGVIVTGSRLTLRQYLTEWLDGPVRLKKLRPQTMYLYRVHCDRITRHIGEIRVTKLTRRHIEGFYGKLLAGGAAPKTVRVIHTVLHSALEAAVQRDILVRNPTQGVTLPKIEKQEPKALPKEHLHMLFAASAETRWGALWILLACTGLRKSEATGLRWADLKEETRQLRIQRQVTRDVDRHLTLGPLKSRAAYRTITLPPSVIVALKKHRVRQAEERLRSSKWQDQGMIFPGTWGQLMDPSTVYDALTSQLTALGLPAVGPHQLRHTAATLWLEANKHPKGVAEFLGHADVGTTLNTYSHVTGRMMEEMADSMEGLLFGAP